MATNLIHPTDRAEVKYDVMLGNNYPTRMRSRVSREEAIAFAEVNGCKIDFDRARMIGNTTAEVPMVRD